MKAKTKNNTKKLGSELIVDFLSEKKNSENFLPPVKKIIFFSLVLINTFFVKRGVVFKMEDQQPRKRWRARDDEVPIASELVSARFELEDNLLRKIGRYAFEKKDVEPLTRLAADYFENVYTPMELTYGEKWMDDEASKEVGEAMDRLFKEVDEMNY